MRPPEKLAPPIARSVGRRIASLRGEIRLTQEKLAWEAGVSSKAYVSRIEHGVRAPSVDVLAKIADRLGVEVRDLFIFPSKGPVHAAMDAIRRGGPNAAQRVLTMLGEASTIAPANRKLPARRPRK